MEDGGLLEQILDKTLDVYYNIYSNNIVDIDRYIIHTTEETVYFKTIETLIIGLLEEIAREWQD